MERDGEGANTVVNTNSSGEGGEGDGDGGRVTNTTGVGDGGGGASDGVYTQGAYSHDLARVRAYITGLDSLLGSYDKDPDIQVTLC
jgi:hypothetical protein